MTQTSLLLSLYYGSGLILQPWFVHLWVRHVPTLHPAVNTSHTVEAAASVAPASVPAGWSRTPSPPV